MLHAMGCLRLAYHTIHTHIKTYTEMRHIFFELFPSYEGRPKSNIHTLQKVEKKLSYKFEKKVY